jgi:hypothetical protein
MRLLAARGAGFSGKTRSTPQAAPMTGRPAGSKPAGFYLSLYKKLYVPVTP